MYERRFARSYADADEAAREIASTLLIEPAEETEKQRPFPLFAPVQWAACRSYF